MPMERHNNLALGLDLVVAQPKRGPTSKRKRSVWNDYNNKNYFKKSSKRTTSVVHLDEKPQYYDAPNDHSTSQRKLFISTKNLKV